MKTAADLRAEFEACERRLQEAADVLFHAENMVAEAKTDIATHLKRREVLVSKLASANYRERADTKNA